MKELAVIQKRRIYMSISIIFVVLSIVSILMWGFKLGIDFTSGSLLEVRFAGVTPTVDEINQNLNDLKLGETFTVQPTDANGFIIKYQNIEEKVHQDILNSFKAKYESKDQAGKVVLEQRFDSIGPSIGKELRTKAFYSIILVNVCIILYVAWSFRKVSFPVQSWKFGVAAILALLHDIIITMGVFSVLGHFAGIEINIPFIVALLTILGYSVNDTIVVFDRIRENLTKLPRLDFESLVNRSINETFARSINTSMTVLLVLLAVCLFGGESIRYFALALIIGVFCGTYSSIFIASPILVVWEKFVRNRNNE